MSTLGVIGFAILWGWEARGQDAPERPQASAPRGQVSGELNFANGLFRDRRYELAAEEYERFLKGAAPGPDADAARFGLASSRLFQGRYAEARRHFEDFVKAAPGHANAPTAWYRIGEAAYMLGDWPAARRARDIHGGQPRASLPRDGLALPGRHLLPAGGPGAGASRL